MVKGEGIGLGKLFLYGIFHANLQFSGIPEEQYPLILDRCYWPILELCRDLPIKLGLEFPAFTLETIAGMDPSFIDALKSLIEGKKCELIGSGYSQNIYPLIPAQVNNYNAVLGNGKYWHILGVKPSVAYVNEQVYASGLTELYLKNGYKSIFVDWDNTSMACPLPQELRYAPQMIEHGQGSKLQVIWNSFISFQRFQRYIHGDLSLEQYIEYLLSHWKAGENRSFPFYGSDWEIFDYRPGNPDYFHISYNGEEICRFKNMLEAIISEERFSLLTPSEVTGVFPEGETINVVSPEYPLPCKKQVKYNVTRWAVCGRENTKKNTQCYRLMHNLQNLSALDKFASVGVLGVDELDKSWRDLCYLWGSDFRTFTTEEKEDRFHNLMGYNLEKADRLRQSLIDKITCTDGFLLLNPLEEDWDKVPFAFELKFKPGQVRYPFAVNIDCKKVLHQVENIEYYKDGSVRKAALVVCPEIPAMGLGKGQIVPLDKVEESPNVTFAEYTIETPVVKAEFNITRGLAIKSLTFPQINNLPLVGTLSHEFYDQVDLSTDQYTGHVIIDDHQLGKVTDLNKADTLLPDNLARYPIRIPVKAKIKLPVGQLWKTVFVYVDEPRIDLSYHFRLQDLHPQSFRMGMLTVNPQAFDAGNLRYVTANGGNDIETFQLSSQNINQESSVDPRFSTSHCLGSTEGWVSVGDDEKSVASITHKSGMYSVPLLSYKKTKESFYLRLYNSISEKDETSSQFWRGHIKFDVSFYGHKKEDQKIRRVSEMINRGLILIS